jgi:exonuclease SbcD
MRLFHASDLHYCPKHVEYVDKAFGAAWSHFKASGIGPWIVAGDSFDATMGIHQPAFAQYLSRIVQMASDAPGLVLQGTFSHDYPGSLNPLKEIHTRHPVHVADAPGIWLLEWISGRKEFQWISVSNKNAAASRLGEVKPKLVAVCIPSLNRADPEVRENGAQNYLASLAARFGGIARVYRKANVPVVLVTHGTVIGCYTESRHAMVSPDHEFSIEGLAAFSADAVLLGHIHKHQSWEHDGCQIVYPGSLAKLVFGHSDPTGYVAWNFDDGARSISWEHVEIPSRIMAEFEYNGPPDLDELDAAAKKLTDGAASPVFARVRWEIDEEHAKRVDPRKVRAIFEDRGITVKIEQRVNKVESVRAKGISDAMTTQERLGFYLVSIGDEEKLDPLTQRLNLVRDQSPETIVSMIAEDRPE